MINKLYTIASISLLSFALVGLSSCVNEGTSITLIGVAAPTDCAAGESATTISLGYLEEGITEYAAHLNVINNLSESSAWSSSSSSSSSGSTFEPTLPSMNTVYLEKLVIVCKKIDGNEDACSGKDDIKANLGDFPLRAGGTGLKGALIQLETWGSFSKSIEFDMYVVYHDSGKFSDESNSIGFEIRRPQITFAEYIAEKKCVSFTSESACAHYGQDLPNPQLWTCEEDKDEDKDKENGKTDGGGGGGGGGGEEEPEEWI